MDACRSGRNKMMHSINQKYQYQKKDDIDVDNISSINFNSKCSVITANLKTSSNQDTIVAFYTVDIGIDGNIMPLHIYKKLFPRATNEQLMVTKIETIKLKM